VETIVTRKAAAKPYRVIQVPIDDELLRRIDVAADRVSESRAAYIRRACVQRLTADQAADLDRRYVEAYREKPEARAWGTVGAKFLSRRLRKDRW
jgi:hypothetical protein